jgi:hypothetical protein
MQRGEVVGIPSTELRACPFVPLRAGSECNEGTGIGRNGAGKSTLPSTEFTLSAVEVLRTRLKILSRSTEPTSGRSRR